MTNRPRAPDWYPDPSGKPGLMYWDGRQWHTEMTATPSRAEQPPEELMPTATQPQRQTALIAALCAAVLVMFGIVGITTYLLLKQSHQPTAAPQQAPSVPVTQPAPPSSTQTTQPAPTSSVAPSSPAPTPQYFKTPSGKTCLVTPQQVTCQDCIPGQVITNAYTCSDPAPAVAVNPEGIVDHNAADVGSPSDAPQLSPGQTYHVNGWTIVSSGGWARFINDSTGHGMAVAAQNFDSF